MKSVLSFQSSVSFGAVGNTMATAVLSEFGHICHRVDTIQLIAHPGHGHRAGGAIPDQDFSTMLDGIFDFSLDHGIDSLMTGYMGTPAQVIKIADTLSKLSHKTPDMDVLVDPAFGDHGRLYVDHEIAAKIASDLMPLATVITPNFFEFQFLTQHQLKTKQDAYDAGKTMLERYPRVTAIMVTGCALEDGQISDLWIGRDNTTSYDAPLVSQDNKGMSGGGDLFAAIVMGIRLSGKSWSEAFLETAPLSRLIINDAGRTGAKDIDIAAMQAALRDRA